jgi:hypothetical protein
MYDPKPILVEMPNKTYATSTHIAKFNNPNMPAEAHTICLFPHMKDFLLSLGILCNNSCTATFMKDKCCMYNSDGRVILKGNQGQSIKFLWHPDSCNNQPDFLTAEDIQSV